VHLQQQPCLLMVCAIAEVVQAVSLAALETPLIAVAAALGSFVAAAAAAADLGCAAVGCWLWQQRCWAVLLLLHMLLRVPASA
jgi:hypothetical protein